MKSRHLFVVLIAMALMLAGLESKETSAQLFQKRCAPCYPQQCCPQPCCPPQCCPLPCFTQPCPPSRQTSPLYWFQLFSGMGRRNSKLRVTLYCRNPDTCYCIVPLPENPMPMDENESPGNSDGKSGSGETQQDPVISVPCQQISRERSTMVSGRGELLFTCGTNDNSPTHCTKFVVPKNREGERYPKIKIRLTSTETPGAGATKWLIYLAYDPNSPPEIEERARTPRQNYDESTDNDRESSETDYNVNAGRNEDEHTIRHGYFNLTFKRVFR